MALFKIAKGNSTNLESNRPNRQEGFIYLTQDDMKFHIDTGSGTTANLRRALNASQADVLKAWYTNPADTAGTWTVTIDDLLQEDIKDGLTVRVRLSTSYNETFNTLNVNGFGAKVVYYRQNARLTNHLPQYSEVLLTYREEHTRTFNGVTYSIPGAATADYINNGVNYGTSGWILDASYSEGNNYDRLLNAYERRRAGTQITKYKLCMVDANGLLQPISIGDTDANTKTANTVPLDPSRIIYYSQNGTTEAFGITASNVLYEAIPLTKIKYTINADLPTYSDLYLVGTVNADGLFVLDSDFYKIVTEPNSSSSPTLANNTFTKGKYYLYVGSSFSSTNYLQLLPSHALYYCDDTNGKKIYPVTHRPTYTKTFVGTLDWDSSTNEYLVSKGAMAYWNGAYSGTSSNLEYTKVGKLGSIATAKKGSWIVNRVVYAAADDQINTANNLFTQGSNLAVNKTSITTGFTFEVNGKSAFYDDIYLSCTDTTSAESNSASLVFVYENTTTNKTGTAYLKLGGGGSASTSGLLQMAALGGIAITSGNAGGQFSSNNADIILDSGAQIYLEANGVNESNRIGFKIDLFGNVIPIKQEGNNTNDQSLGSSNSRWKALFVGTDDTYGSSSTPIYWNNGVPTAIDMTFITGSATKLAYYSTGSKIESLTSNIGSTTQPVYINAGYPTACTYTLGATINAGTANQVAYYSGANTISSKAPAWGAWTAGTTAGPKANIQIGNATYTSDEIPAAGSQASGIVTTDLQSFAGVKKFVDTTESTSISSGAVQISGGLAVAKNQHIGGALEIHGFIAADASNTGHGAQSGGGYHKNYNSILLHGDDTTGSSGILFVSDKGSTNAAQPTDRAFIQFHANGVTTYSAEGTDPTIASSGENGQFVIGVGNDTDDQIRLQTPGRTGLLHQVGASGYVIPDTNNTTGSVGAAKTPIYVDGGIIKSGTALKDLAYIDKATSNATSSYLRGDGTWSVLDVAAVGVAAATGNQFICQISETSGKIDATLSTASIGGSVKPIYIDSGVITPFSVTVGDGTKLMYLDTGELTVSSSTVGTDKKPVYLSNGQITVCTYELNSSVSSGTKDRMAYFSDANVVSASTITSNGDYLGNITYLSINTAHQTNYKLFVEGVTKLNGNTTINGDIIFPVANKLDWNDGIQRQRIVITDDGTVNTAVFTFQQSIDSGSNYTDLMTIDDAGKIIATSFEAAASKGYTINGKGAIWHNGSNLYVGSTGSGTNVFSGNLYLLGGLNSSSKYNQVAYLTLGATSTATTGTNYPIVHEDKAGSATKGIYLDPNGKTCEMTYSLSATINSSTATYLAYYSGTNEISGTSSVRIIDGCLNLYPTSSSQREGMRIHPYDGWADIVLMGYTNTNTSGIAATDWLIGNNDGTFYLTHNGGSSSTTGYLKAYGTTVGNESQGYWELYDRLGINGADTAYNLYVNGNTHLVDQLVTDGYYWNTAPTKASGAIRFSDQSHTHITTGIYYRPWFSGSESVTNETNYGNSWSAGLYANTDDTNANKIGFYFGTAWNDNATTDKVWYFTRSGVSYIPNHVIPQAHQTYDLGESIAQWRTLYSQALQINGVNSSYNLYVNGPSYLSGATTIIGDTSITGNMTITGNIVPGINNTYSLGAGGASPARWKEVYIGTADTYGSGIIPIYWNDGIPTPSSSTVGSGIIPMYLNAGTLTASTSTVGSGIIPMYLNAGTLTASSSTVGSDIIPMYLSAGTLTASTSTVGSGIIPMYLNAGTLTASTSTVGSGIKPIYLNDGTITVSASTVGSATQPVYLNAGTITVGSYALNATVNSGTQYYLAYYSSATAISSASAKILNDCLSLYPTAGSYREGIRIHSYSDWSDILLCGTDNTADSGTSANSWFLGNNNGSFYITRNGSTSGSSCLYCSASDNYWRVSTRLYNAVWNDFAEYRESESTEGGRVVYDDGTGIMKITQKRLQSAARIISDTFGIAVGESDRAKTPIGVGGRVLAYTYQDTQNYQVGDAVCAAPNGTIDIMTREEIINYPDRIIGIVSEIPIYSIWKNELHNGDHGIAEVSTKGRIWIYVK